MYTIGSGDEKGAGKVADLPTAASCAEDERNIKRINRVIDYIDEHLDQEMSLEDLSKVAHVSAYHFHRVFKRALGEPPSKYIRRVRIERAAAQLAFNPGKRITEIALDSGFSSAQFFSRAFRQYFGMCATDWRRAIASGTAAGSPRKPVMAEEVSFAGAHSADRAREGHPGLVSPIRVANLSETRVVYVRRIGVDTNYTELFLELYARLNRWSSTQGIRPADAGIVALFRDHPVITAKRNLRITLCTPIPRDRRDVIPGTCRVGGGRYAVGRFELSEPELESAWKYLYCRWLPGSGYQLGDAAPVEYFLRYPCEQAAGKFVVDICLPVKPL